MSAYEHETTITYDDGDRLVRVWSCRRADVQVIRKSGHFQVLGGGTLADGSEWAEATVRLEDFSLARAIKKRRIMTPEQRAAVAARLAAARGGAR